MKITKKGEYALRALLDLAYFYNQKTLNLRAISEHNKIPYKFLEQIMMTLKHANFVESVKGKMGGYSLKKSPDEITVGEVIRAVEGPLSPVANAHEIKKRVESEIHSGLYFTFLEVRNAISDVLDKKTLADVCEKSSELNSSKFAIPMYYI